MGVTNHVAIQLLIHHSLNTRNLRFLTIFSKRVEQMDDDLSCEPEKRLYKFQV